MKKCLLAFAVVLLISGCSTTPEVSQNIETLDPIETVDAVDSVTLKFFTFTLPSGWKLISQTDSTAKISIPNYESYELSLDMSLIQSFDEESAPTSEDTVKTTDEGVQIYKIGCGGVFDCGNLAAFGDVFEYTFDIESTEPVPADLDGVWAPNSSVSHDDIDAFIATVKPTFGSDWAMLDQGDFTLYAPSGWLLTPEQGIDSYVGTVSGNGINLKYAYGDNVAALSSDSEYVASEYSVTNDTFNSQMVTIYTPKLSGTGNMEIYFESPRGEGNFILFGENLTSDQEALALQIFDTINFKQ
ncbi:MAG: hypothetical protein WCT46_06815 [Candidatus Gracilibacteria bacterium]|jgi:hypothetical protein